jgi:hypothetical protein
MESKYGKDLVGVPVTVDGQTMWVNEQMVFATLMAIVTYLDNNLPDAGNLISLISEKIYDHITQNEGPVDRSGATGQGTSDGSDAA